MTATLTALARWRQNALCSPSDLRIQIEAALARTNRNAGRNVYLAADYAWTLEQAAALPVNAPAESLSLYGVPVSLKDCFDLAGFPTTCGSRAYRAEHGVAAADSWVAEKLRSKGAVLTGKTHLHQLAYGITGENADYGDCLQPLDGQLLTGGSSSGAAASVQEGSAFAAIGTDTGGSIRVPAALCGLAGYRASLGLGDWRGGAHLAPSFDTIGWLFRDLRDAPLLASALFDLPLSVFAGNDLTGLRIGSVDALFLYDCDLAGMHAFTGFQQSLRAWGASVEEFETTGWVDAFDVFTTIQANEAAAIHGGRWEGFEPAIAERLRWGASLESGQMMKLRERHLGFRDDFERLFDRYDFLILPCAPVSRLPAGNDHSAVRKKILRYTSPASLAGTPVVAVPLHDAGVQVVGRHGADAALVAFAAWLGERLPPLQKVSGASS